MSIEGRSAHYFQLFLFIVWGCDVQPHSEVSGTLGIPQIHVL